jgi:riboflavin-specific deaminase-like protein
VTQLRRLYPEGDALDLTSAADELELAALAPAERPYVIANMVSALDGRATIDGRSAQLGDEADKELFGAMRSRVDAILVGPGTLRAERYGALARTPEARERRRKAGLAERPLAVVLSRSLELPLEIGLFTDPGSEIVVFTQSGRELPRVPAQLEVVRLDPSADAPTRALRFLRAERDVRSLLCEGGPRMLGSLVAADLLDELALTLAPKIAGGSGPTIVTSPAFASPPELELVSALEHGSELLLRYRVRHGR